MTEAFMLVEKLEEIILNEMKESIIIWLENVGLYKPKTKTSEGFIVFEKSEAG